MVYDGPWPASVRLVATDLDGTLLRADDTVFVFSDGAYEIETSSGAMLQYDAFLSQLSQSAVRGDGQIPRLLEFAVAESGGPLDDDFTMLCVTLA